MANPVVINDATWTDAVGGVGVVSAVEARNAIASTVAHTAAGVRTGVYYEGTQSLITGTATTSPNMTVQVAPLAFCGSKSSTEGVYIGRSPQTVTVDIAAAPASNSRIDSVYVMQRDQNATTSPDSVTQGEIGVITGTAGVTPTAPAVPTGAVLLGTVTVASGVTATTNAGCTVATTCQFTTGQGAPIPVRNQSERDALSAYDGMRVYRLDTHALETYGPSAWQQGRVFLAGGAGPDGGFSVSSPPIPSAAAPASFWRDAAGVVHANGGFGYTTGQAAVGSRSLGAIIPASMTAQTARGTLSFIVRFHYGSTYTTGLLQIDPQANTASISRPDGTTFSWAGNDNWIFLDGVHFDAS